MILHSNISKSRLTAMFSMLLVSSIFITASIKAEAENDFFDPVALLLTWQQDPTTTMTIDWHTINEDRETVVDYRIQGESRWNSTSGSNHPFPYSERTIHRVELTGLQPGTVYEFRFGEGSKNYTFRTMPATAEKPLRIAVGGDTMHRKAWMEKTARQAMKFDLDFVLIGGDLAYADGLKPEDQNHRDPQTPRVENQWYSWLDAYKNTLITDDFRVIPIVVSIGNHEVHGGYWWREDRHPENFTYRQDDEAREIMSPYFYSLFALPGQPGYNVLDFGDYMSIVILDTDHNNPIDGEQTEWLENVLSERRDRPHVFPIYHVPAYPSVRDYNDDVHVRVREHWVPLFEENNLRVVFEKHDHAYKRTHPIRNGEVASNGIIYMGDGAWGTAVREIGARQDYDAWYIDNAQAKRHFILLTVHGPHQHMLVIDSHGNKIDEYPESPAFTPAMHPASNR